MSTSTSPVPAQRSPQQAASSVTTTAPSQSPPLPSAANSMNHQLMSPPSSSSSSSQLASLLSKALQEVETLKRELDVSRRRQSKFERLAALSESSMANGTTTNGAQSVQPSEAALKAVIDAENRAERAERAKDELESRLQNFLSQWSEVDRHMNLLEARAHDTRAAFARQIGALSSASETASSQLSLPPIPLSNLPIAPLPSHSVQGPNSQSSSYSTRRMLPTSTGGSSHATLRSALSTPFGGGLPLPPPPSATTSMSAQIPSKRSHRRSRLEDYDHPYKRGRYDNDRDSSPAATHQQPSPPYTNASIGAPVSHSAHDARVPTSHGGSGAKHVAGQSPYDGAPAHGYLPRHHGSHAQSHSLGSHRSYERERERGRDSQRAYGQRDRSASRSSAGSSLSIDEMLLEATTDRQRDGYAGGRHGRGGALAAGGVGGPPPVGDGGLTVRPEVGPHREPPSLQQYQTHIFAAPVTGAPMKKNKTVPANQLVTLGPGGVIVSGGGQAAAQSAHALPGGGFPPTNAQGQRICRQCGMAGRYKEGKCVEKWGPGPEGPGTVCDRCRKKMKRVERRGTMDQASQSFLSSRPNVVINNRSTPLSGTHSNRASPPRRQDTMVVERESESQRTQMLSPRPSYSYTANHGDHSAAASSRSHSPGTERAYPVNSSSTLATSNARTHRRAPTPPYINSISTREQYAGSRSPSAGEDDEVDIAVEGDGDNDVDTEIARMLPGSQGRRGAAGSRSGSGTASVGSVSPKHPGQGKEHVNGVREHANGTSHLAHLANAAVNGAAAEARSKRSPAGIGAGGGDADSDADILDAVEAADSGRLKVEDT